MSEKNAWVVIMVPSVKIAKKMAARAERERPSDSSLATHIALLASDAFADQLSSHFRVAAQQAVAAHHNAGYPTHGIVNGKAVEIPTATSPRCRTA